MHKLGLEPDIVDKFPSCLLEITYENNIKVNGNTLTPTQVKKEPHVRWDANPKSYYALLMIDPDSPSRKSPIFREWQHWLVGNIPGNHVHKGEVLREYIGAGPLEGTDAHRYVFLLYQQQNKIRFAMDKLTNLTGKNREKFDSRKFSHKYHLGEPIAGNCFVALYDDYVPILYQQLGYMPLNLAGII